MTKYNIKRISLLFKSLSDPTRIRILLLLSNKPLCVCEITEVIKLAPSTISKHLSLMSASSILDSKKIGKWVYYEINKSKSAEYIIAKLLIELLKNDIQTKSDKEKLKQIREGTICKTN